MSWKSLLLILLCLMAVQVFCQNQMNLMTTLYGEFSGDEFGAEMVAMDYNGDGYDDLIVVATFWNDTGVLGYYYPGKVYFYWGGPTGLANTPDYVIEGQSHQQFAPYMCNAGDMNGDGIDDLAITYSNDIPWGAYKSIAIYLGTSDPHPEPDYLATIPYTSVRPHYMGDINGDGKNDLSIWGQYYSHRNQFLVYIWTDVESSPDVFMNSYNGGMVSLSGIGDVNQDGFDDAYLTYSNNLANLYENRAVLVFGDDISPFSDSVVVEESFIDGYPCAARLGDINGDGFADFIGYQIYPNHYVWLGSTELDSIPDLSICLNSPDHDMHAFGREIFKYAVYGDLNGDGYDDFVCSDPEANTYNGQAGLWLGGSNVNATVDLVFNPPSDWQLRNFGYAKAIGDFNGDHFDDLALSCPRWMDGSFHDPGRVYVFSGNAQLEDTTVAIEDPIVPPVNVADWIIDVYPNPSPKGHGNINVKLHGESYLQRGQYSYQLFNIRGQQIKDGLISDVDVINRSFIIAYDGLPAGIYQVAVLYNSEIKDVKRIVVYQPGR